MFNTYALGAYGTCNIGDDAILHGILTKAPNLIPIAHSPLCDHSPIFILDAAADKNLFKKGDTLILGGGGLFYSKLAILDWLKFANNASSSGANFEIRAVGFEDYIDDFYDPTFQLFSLASKITFRTNTSLQIYKNIFPFNAEIESDFATLLKPKFNEYEEVINTRLSVGVVTTGSIHQDYSELISLINHFKNVDFFHIPHSRSPLGWENNDFVVGEYINTFIKKSFKEPITNFYTSSSSINFQDVMNIYKKMNAVISYRFHGVIFSDFFNLSCGVMRAESLKQRSSLEYNKRAVLINTKEDLFEFVNNLI